jgi:EAL domain-containing protein (putative c-di-GMP-specific phosphodiesterase class I)
LVVDVDRVKRIVQSLRALGLVVAVDDFGTGYSSLAALQQFELDVLKIDRSFMSLIHTPQGEAVCRTIVTLGHALGMTVIGEGVETLEQAKILARLGCEQVQGFYFARPMAAELACRATSVERLLPMVGPSGVAQGSASKVTSITAVMGHHSRMVASSRY